MLSISERAAAYLERMPPAIAGSGGHTAAFNAAAIVAIGFNLNDEDAFAVLTRWNAACLPPWTERELRQKITSARKDCRRPPGYLLDDAPSRPGAAPDRESENELKARQRQSWPLFKALKPAGLEVVARLRHIPLRAVILAARAGFLSGGMVDGQPCFILHEGTFAQARRLDGLPFDLTDGRQVKAKNLPGAQGAFIGARWLGSPTMNVLVVEGCVGLLEALAAHELTDPAQGWTILAATSASSRFHRAPDLLARLKGRRVRIVPDADEAGLEAAATWLAALEHAGAFPDAIELPPGCIDLGPIVSDSLSYQPFLTALFQ